MDLTESIVPKSDQLNAEDLLSGPRTVTIADVRAGSSEQPVEVVTDEFGPGRPFKPSKTVRRILVAAWGPDASTYTGRRMTLYRDPTVKFGGMDVGGIRVSHLSNIAKPLTLALTVTRGKRAPYVVQPLREEAPKPSNRSAEAVGAFAKLGVTEVQLTKRVGRPAARWTDGDLTSLLTLFRAIQNGETTVAQAFPAVEQPAPPPEPAPDPDAPIMNARQRGKLFALLGKAGKSEDAARFRFASEELGREITSFSQLSPGDAEMLIALLEAEAQRTPARPEPTDEPGFDGEGWPS